MTDTDPLVPVLTGLVVDLLWFLDSCGDDEVDPDSAVKTLEWASWVLQNLPPDQSNRLLTVLADLATVEKDPKRRKFLQSFPSDFGLLEEPESDHR